jgi:hypothetical protein
MAGTDDKFNRPNLRLPSDFLRQLNLPSDVAQRLSALMSPEVKQGLQRLAQRLQQQHPLLKPRLYEMIASVLQKRRDKTAIEEELRRLESWLDSEGVDRKLWDPTAGTAAPPTDAASGEARDSITAVSSEITDAPVTTEAADSTAGTGTTEERAEAAPAAPPLSRPAAPTGISGNGGAVTDAVVPAFPTLEELELEGQRARPRMEAVWKTTSDICGGDVRRLPKNLSASKLRQMIKARFLHRDGGKVPSSDVCEDFMRAFRKWCAQQQSPGT